MSLKVYAHVKLMADQYCKPNPMTELGEQYVIVGEVKRSQGSVQHVVLLWAVWTSFVGKHRASGWRDR